MQTATVRQFYADRRWGHGRLWQLVVRTYCRVVGHRFGEWHFDWPYDVPDYWEEMGEPVRDPRPNEILTWARGCERECGLVQSAEATLLQRAGLPGRSGGLDDNPIKRALARTRFSITFGGDKL